MCILSFFFPTVSVGYEYESCPDLILWEKRTAVLQGYEIDASKLGGWSLDKHHALNIQSGEWISRIPGARPWCESCVMCFVPCEAKTHVHTHFKFHRLLCDPLVRRVNINTPWQSALYSSLLGTGDTEVKGFKGLHSGQDKHFLGSFHTMPWMVPSQREAGNTVEAQKRSP